MDQKLKNKRKSTWVFKGEIGPESWAVEAVVVAIFKRRGGSSLSMSRGFNLTAILTKFSGEFGSSFHDFSTTIGPRSRRDRVTIVRRLWSWSSIDPRRLEWSRFRGSMRAIAARSRRDRSSIAPRSQLDREVLPPLLCTVRWRSC